MLKDVRSDVEKYYDECLLVSDSVNSRDLGDSFGGDNNKINLIKPGICCKQDIINDILNSLIKLTSVQRIKLAQQRQAIKKLIKIRLIKSRIYGNKLNPIY